MTKSYRVVLPLLGLWLISWTFLSWPGVMDDALIHLRYADNLFLHHFITYDGIHASYGASSLLYVSLLAVLRGMTASANLPRTVSSIVHFGLFSGLAFGLSRKIPATDRTARTAGLLLLTLTVVPSAIRWLDDGMETGLGLVFIGLLVWLVHRRLVAGSTSAGQMLGLAAVAFFAVLLRTEYLMPCGICFAILTWEQVVARGGGEGSSWSGRSWFGALGPLLGAVLALGVILTTMHTLLPDTALAKSHGIHAAPGILHQLESVLASSFSFGLGFLLLWLLTFYLNVRRAGTFTVPTLLANAPFPILASLSMMRGQEMQGVRYLVWTFFFSVLWNTLELARTPTRKSTESPRLLYVLLTLLLLELPVESLLFHRVLTERAKTIVEMESKPLYVLEGKLGIAVDVGYVGYFTGARICDIAGLVNGRAAAKATAPERMAACAASAPDFVFETDAQIRELAKLKDMHGWMICGAYDFMNVHSLDRHYLLVPARLADTVCEATGVTAMTADSLL